MADQESEAEDIANALRRERDFSAAVLDTVDSLIVVLDRAGSVVRFNRACERLSGYTFDEMVGKDLMAMMIAPEDTHVVQSVFQDITVGQFPHTSENDWVTRDGRRHRITWSSTALVDAQGSVEYVIGIGLDVTELRRAEAERGRMLAEAQERADRDPLTELLNHRAFHKRLEEEAGRSRRDGSTMAVVMLDLDNFKFFNDAYGHAVGDEVLRLVAERLCAACGPSDVVGRFGGDEFALILPDLLGATASAVEARLSRDLHGIGFRPQGWGEAVPITVSVGAALLSDAGPDWQEVVRRADERLLRAKTGGAAQTEAEAVRAQAQRSLSGFSMLDALVTAVDNKDRYTRRHSEDVLTHSLEIARRLGLDEKGQHNIAVAALIHDVGKIGVPDAILRKPGRLTDAEFEAVKQHPQMGSIIVQAVPGLEETLDAVRHHHECWDGGGYPFGLRGEECPLMARLMAVADAFSAMTTDRPYRKGMEEAKALTILRDGAGTQWDPTFVAEFLAARA